jgi:hypothetical protein
LSGELLKINRRGFLGAIAGGLVLDPERLLWRPKRYVQGVTLPRIISIPQPRPEDLLISGRMLTHKFFEGSRHLFNPSADVRAQFFAAREEILRSFGVTDR